MRLILHRIALRKMLIRIQIFIIRSKLRIGLPACIVVVKQETIFSYVIESDLKSWTSGFLSSKILDILEAHIQHVGTYCRA